MIIERLRLMDFIRTCCFLFDPKTNRSDFEIMDIEITYVWDGTELVCHEIFWSRPRPNYTLGVVVLFRTCSCSRVLRVRLKTNF